MHNLKIHSTPFVETRELIIQTYIDFPSNDEWIRVTDFVSFFKKKNKDFKTDHMIFKTFDDCVIDLFWDLWIKKNIRVNSIMSLCIKINLPYWRVRPYHQEDEHFVTKLLVKRIVKAPIKAPAISYQNSPITNKPNTMLKTTTTVQNNNFKDYSLLWARNALYDWGYCPNIKNIMEDLKKIALPEQWHLGNDWDFRFNPILENYFCFTFARVRDEGKIIEGSDYASFNTWLVDKNYNHIYALFSKNDGGTSKYKFESFTVEGMYNWKIMISNFASLPEKAKYFDDIRDILFECKENTIQIDENHIFGSLDRFPKNFIESYMPKYKDFEKINPYILPKEEKKKYFHLLIEEIMKDGKLYRNMKSSFLDSVEIALKKAKRDYKTVVPMYYPYKNKISFLVPLALVSDDIIDIALVCEKTESGNYIGVTVLPLPLAYLNARLLYKPSSDWLDARNINMQVNGEGEGDEGE